MAGSKKKDKQNKKPVNKKKLLMLLIPIAVILIAAIAAAVIFVPKFLNKGKKKVVVKPPEFYFTKKDAVDSVSVVLGERRFALIKEAIPAEGMEDTYDFLLGTGTVIPDPEPESEEESAPETGSAVSEDGTEQSGETAQAESAEETVSTAQEEDASETETEETVVLEVYQYYPGEIAGEETEGETEGETESAPEEEPDKEPGEDVVEEAESYMEYLRNEKGFIDITAIAMNMGEFAQEDAEEEETEAAAAEEETQNGPSYHVLTGPAADNDYSLLISVICYPEFYQIRTWRQEMSWTQKMSMLWAERDRQDEERRERELAEEQGETEGAAEEETEEIPTIEEMVSSLGQEALRLPEPVERYEFIYNAGGMLVNGKTYARVGAYFKNEETGTTNYECTFLVDENGEVRYKYYNATGVIESLDGDDAE